MTDSRATLRYAVDLPGRLQLGGTLLACRIRNVSLGGVFVLGPTLTIGTRVLLRFAAPHVPHFEAACVARWHTAEGSGLQFESLRAVDTYALARFIRHASRPTSRLPTDAILRPPAA
jgi:hypothetical protein